METQLFRFLLKISVTVLLHDYIASFMCFLGASQVALLENLSWHTCSQTDNSAGVILGEHAKDVHDIQGWIGFTSQKRAYS